MTWIQTNSGHRFDFKNLSHEAVHVRDIAHALSHVCRFVGHTRVFWSVAQHSLLTSYLVPNPFALEALLHDASEAYCQDIPTPLKALLPDYMAIEDSVDRLVREVFNLPPSKSPEVKRADMMALAMEMDAFMGNEVKSTEAYRIGRELLDGHVQTFGALPPLLTMPAEETKQAFLRRYIHLSDRAKFPAEAGNGVAYAW